MNGSVLSLIGLAIAVIFLAVTGMDLNERTRKLETSVADLAAAPDDVIDGIYIDEHAGEIEINRSVSPPINYYSPALEDKGGYAPPEPMSMKSDEPTPYHWFSPLGVNPNARECMDDIYANGDVSLKLMLENLKAICDYEVEVAAGPEPFQDCSAYYPLCGMEPGVFERDTASMLCGLGGCFPNSDTGTISVVDSSLIGGHIVINDGWTTIAE